METACLTETTEREWCIHIPKVFDLDVAKTCARLCRERAQVLPERMVFDLSQTIMLQTMGLGCMLYLKSRYGVADDNAVIVYGDPEVGLLLRLGRLDRAFQLRQRVGEAVTCA